MLVLAALYRVAEVSEGDIECSQEPHDGMPACAPVAIFEPGDVLDAHADAIGELLLCESGVVAELAQRSTEGEMVLGVVWLVSGHCKSGRVALRSADHTSAPAPL